MATRDKRIDSYIARAPDFARPILEYVRAVVHEACPDVEETLKWSRPHFVYHGMLCGMSSFKAHCAFGFWKGSLLKIPSTGQHPGGMGQFGRLTQVTDLPRRAALKTLVRQAMKLNEAGTPNPRRVRPARPRPPPRPPSDLAKALKANPAARATFAALSPSGQREYVEWLMEAKRAETRAKRLATTLAWLAEGKSRNWAYEKKASARGR
jgi:hypothetical protein